MDILCHVCRGASYARKLSRAIEGGDEEMVRKIALRAHPYAFYRRKTPFVRAVECDVKDGKRGRAPRGMTRLLLQLGVTPNVPDGMTSPLHVAAMRGEVDLARALLEAGARVNARDAHGWTPAHECAAAHFTRSPAMVRLLKAYGADFSARTHDGETVEDLFGDSSSSETETDTDAP